MIVVPAIPDRARARRPEHGLRVLFVAPYAPSPIRVRPFQLLRHLVGRGHVVTLVCAVSGPADQDALEALRELCAVVAVPHGRGATLRAYLKALPGSLPLQAAHCLNPALVAAVREAMASGGFDVVHIEHLRGAEVARAAAAGLPAAPPLVLDAVDSISLLFERTVRQSPVLAARAMALLDLARTRRYEAAYGRRFAHVVITSPEDRWALRTLRAAFGEPSGAPITVVPNGVDCAYFQPSQTARDPATVLFSGKMSYHANEAAALFLLEEIMPLVWRRRPTARVVIAGAQPGARVRAYARDPRVAVTGYVPDLRPYLARASVAVAPLRYGVGVQNKVLEAMAMGAPVVAARQATLALNARPGVELQVADDARSYADRIVELIDDPTRGAIQGQAGRAYVERHHNWDGSAGILEHVYEVARRTVGA
ncbi:MAG: glycosyltransferase [Chloroflexaceae bacterium]|nr:glycosyltransferase [Chloroflexaceae bacterium]